MGACCQSLGLLEANVTTADVSDNAAISGFCARSESDGQASGVWIVVTDPDAYLDAEKALLEDVKVMCRKQKVILFISRAKDLPNGWQRYDEQ